MEQNEATYEMKPVFGWYVSDKCNSIVRTKYNYREYL